MKLVYVLGPIGSCKTRVARRLVNGAVVITGDRITKAIYDALHPNEPVDYLREVAIVEGYAMSATHAADRNNLVRIFETTLREVIAEYGYAASKSTTVVASGQCFRCFVLRAAIEQALRLSLCWELDYRLFYLALSPRTVVDNLQKLGLVSSIEAVEEQQRTTQKRLGVLPAVSCHADERSLEKGVKEFMNTNAAASLRE